MPCRFEKCQKKWRVVWNELSLAPIKEDNTLSFYVGIQKDVTQEVLRERVLVQNLEKNRIFSMQGTISALANEINQPLSAIATYSKSCHLLMQEQGERNWDTLSNSLEKIEIHALMIGEIIYCLNNSFNESLYPKEKVNINRLIAKTVALLANGYNVPIVLNLCPRLPGIEVSPMHLTQIILNLIRNSFEAFDRVSQDNGKIFINTGLTKNNIEINFIDNGPGMPEAFRNNDIGSFFTSKPYGVGTGFSVCKKLIALYDGTMDVQSDHAGFRVQLNLPIN